MNFGEPYACKQTTALASFTHSIRGKATSRSLNNDSQPTKKTGTRPVFFVGGEAEIRTLEPCYRLHDFQSCALDQLGEFSVLLHKYNISFFKNQVFFINYNLEFISRVC